MNYLEDDIKFFSRLVNGSQSGVIASAEQVKDYNWNQGAGAFQNVINNYLKEQIDLKNKTISAEDREVLNYLKLIKNGLVTNEQGILNYSENSVEIGTSNGGNSQNPTKTAVIITGANSEHAGLMTAQDKRKLDTLSTVGVGSILFFDQYITTVLPSPQEQSIGAIDGRRVIYSTDKKGFMIQYENKYYISTADNLLNNIGVNTNAPLPGGIRKPFEQTIYIAKDTFIPYVLDHTTDVLKPLNVNKIENVTV